MEYLHIALKILLAVTVGGVVGWERGSGHRAAGFRTYILVSMGAAIAMMTGETVAVAYGGDATRMAASTISGVGFLGAGTILKTGINVKGLTTAASLWGTAVLGLASGAGLYPIALGGLVMVMVTLTVLERIEQRFPYGKSASAIITLKTVKPSDVVGAVEDHLRQMQVTISKVTIEGTGGDGYEVRVDAQSRDANNTFSFAKVSVDLCALPNVDSLSIEEY